jgi:hypothetical protein
MFKAIHPQVAGIRRAGSAALDLAYLAAILDKKTFGSIKRRQPIAEKIKQFLKEYF